MDLNLRDIRALVAVAEAGSFTRAAERLHLSQPALTVQIRRLEDVVGARLFDRNSRNVALTPTGRELLPLLRKSLQDMENVLRDARALGEGESGAIRIACLPTFAASVLPELILGMKRDVPRAVFQIRDVVASTCATRKPISASPAAKSSRCCRLERFFRDGPMVWCSAKGAWCLRKRGA